MLKLVDNNIKPMPNKPLPYMWCFGGHNVSIEVAKIKTVECLYYHEYGSKEYIPNLLFTLKDGTKITIDFDNMEEAHESLMYYKRELIKRVQ